MRGLSKASAIGMKNLSELLLFLNQMIILCILNHLIQFRIYSDTIHYLIHHIPLNYP